MDADRNSGAYERYASGRIHAKAVNASVQSHKHAIHINHRHRTNIMVTGNIFLYDGVIGIALCLLDGKHDLNTLGRSPNQG